MDPIDFQSPLWTKEESTDRYVDIFSDEFHGIDVGAVESEIDVLFASRRKKDDAKSIEYRLEGNEYFRQSRYHLALEKYNRAVCYAETGGNVMNVAYSNRATTFFKLRLYKECLNDIEMLQRSTNYPIYLREKLIVRHEECLRRMGDTTGEVVRIDNQQVTLSSGEHDLYAGVADCLKLEWNNEWGRHVNTTRALELNETVMIEKPFSFVGHECNELKYYRCSHCYRSLMNLIPCNECVNSMFCNEKCLEEAQRSRHKFECKLAKMEMSDCECKEKQFQLVLDVMWKINSTLDSVDDLIRTVESNIRGESVATGADARTDDTLKGIETILKLETNREKVDYGDFQRLIQCSVKNYSVLMRLPEFNEKFVTEEHKRFLKHLILHVIHIARQATLFNDLNVDVFMFREAELRDYGIGLYPIGSFLNHSCVPNVYCYSVDNRLICKVVRPIKSGEQLFRSYICGQMIINDDDDNDPSYHFLETEYKFRECKCSYCSLRKTSHIFINPRVETKDQDYLQIHSVLSSDIDRFFRMTDEERQLYADKAISYLNNHDELDPTNEKFVVQMYLQNFWMLTTQQG